MSKVKFGLKNAYYAVATINEDGSATYAQPKRLPGAVSITMDPSGDATSFYADDIEYFRVAGATGYTGELSLAMIPDDFRKDCLGEDGTTEGALIEMGDAVAKPFALLFEFTTDEKAQKFVMYRCTAARPNIGSNTKAETTEVQPETISISASAVYNAAKKGNIVKTKVNEAHAAYDSWYTSVWQPTE